MLQALDLRPGTCHHALGDSFRCSWPRRPAGARDRRRAGGRRGAFLSLGDVGGTAALDLLADVDALCVFGNWEASGLRGMSQPYRGWWGAGMHITATMAGAGHASPVWPAGLGIAGVVDYLRQHGLHWLALFPSLQHSEEARGRRWPSWRPRRRRSFSTATRTSRRHGVAARCGAAPRVSLGQRSSSRVSRPAAWWGLAASSCRMMAAARVMCCTMMWPTCGVAAGVGACHSVDRRPELSGRSCPSDGREPCCTSDSGVCPLRRSF